MSKKSKNNLNPKDIIDWQKVNYHLSTGIKILLFFTFPLWIIPFIVSSIFLGIKFRNALQNIITSGFSTKPNFSQIPVNSLEFYNRDMELKNANKALIITQQQWQEMLRDEILIKTFDNVRLATFIFRAKTLTDKWVIVCHGWGQNRYSILYLALPYYQAGYNVLVYDARNHGSSTKSSCTFGINEAQDLFYVIKYLSEKVDSEQITKKISLIGNSMGAVTILQALQTYDLVPLGVKCAIFDCGFDDFSSIVKTFAQRKTNIHWFWSYFGVSFWLWLKDGLRINNLKPINKMKFSAQTPILFIHGLADQTVPVTMAKNLYQEKIKYEMLIKNKICSELLLVPNAGHTQSIISDYHQYCQKILQFTNHWISK